MTSFSADNLVTFGSLTRKVVENTYPKGEIKAKATTNSVEGPYKNSLSGSTQADYLSGHGIYRSAKYGLLDGLNSTESTFDGIIVGGAENAVTLRSNNSDENAEGGISLLSEDSLSADPKSAIVKTRGAAQAALMASIAKSGQDQVLKNSIARAMARLNGAISSEGTSLSATSIDGNIHDGTYNYITGVELTGAVGRDIALGSTMSEQELGWHRDRLRVLNDTGIVEDSENLVNGFAFDIPNDIANLRQTEQSYGGSFSTSQVSQDLINGTSSSVAYLAPALIELLIYLSSDDSGISIKCNTGVSSQIVSSNDVYNINGSTVGMYVLDHVFGRAVDITNISRRNGQDSVNFNNNGGGVSGSTFRVGFELLMEELNIIGMSHPYLLPDSISVHPDLATEYEITDDDFELGNSPLRVRYPGLANVDFHSGISEHRNHIHLSFGAYRSGIYSGPGVLALEANGLDSSVDFSDGHLDALPQIEGTYVLVGDIFSNPRLNTSYRNSQVTSLSAQEVFDLLRGTVCSDEAAAIFTAIAERESNFRPAAFNPQARISGSTSGSSGESFVTPNSFIAKGQEALGQQSSRGYSLYISNSPTAADVAKPASQISGWDCSGFIYWIAYQLGIYFKQVGGRWQLTNIASENADWSTTNTIRDIMVDAGNLFTLDNGTPDVETALNTPGAILVYPWTDRDTNLPVSPGASNGVSGHVGISMGNGYQIINAANSIDGLKLSDATASAYKYIDGTYKWTHVGYFPGVNYSDNIESSQSGSVTGDWSATMWQINMLAHGDKDFSFFFPNNGTQYGWKLAYDEWLDEGISNFEQFLTAAGNAGNNYRANVSGYELSEMYRYLSDEILIPVNQAFMLYKIITGTTPNGVLTEDQKLGLDPQSSYYFFAWGDYGGGPDYGWISNVDFQTAVEVYEASTGKSKTVLRDWVLEMFNTAGASSKSSQYAQNWVNGWYYEVIYSGGWQPQGPVRRTIINY